MLPNEGAAIICFPWDRNVGKARRVAEVYLRRGTDKAREAYWQDVVETLACMLRRRGFDEEEIGLQVEGLRRAVSAELSRGAAIVSGRAAQSAADASVL